MSGNFVAPVQISSQNVVEISFKQVGGTEAESASTSLSASFDDRLREKDPEISGDEDRFLCQCTLNIKCDMSDADKKPVSSTNCIISGVFAIPVSLVPDETIEAKRNEFMHANALAMNYSKARAVIEAASAESLCGKVTIPAILPYEYLKSVDGASEKSDNS